MNTFRVLKIDDDRYSVSIVNATNVVFDDEETATRACCLLNAEAEKIMEEIEAVEKRDE